MKKFITIFIIIVLLSSCEKEDLTPRNSQCNCGIIANDGITNNCYWLEIRNECTNNKKKFCFDQDIWMRSYVGNRFCVTNEPQW